MGIWLISFSYLLYVETLSSHYFLSSIADLFNLYSSNILSTLKYSEHLIILIVLCGTFIPCLQRKLEDR